MLQLAPPEVKDTPKAPRQAAEKIQKPLKSLSSRMPKVLNSAVSQLAPPEIKDTPEAPRQAAEKLQQMGPMTRDERIMLGTMGFALALWVSLLCCSSAPE